MQYIVTGGKGFIGKHLVSALEDKADPHWSEPNVRVLDRPDSIQDLHNEYFKFNHQPPDFIFHLAATARVGVSLETPEAVIQNNIAALLRVLSFCRAYPTTKLILASSSSVKFADLEKNPYALSKKMCEDLVNLYRTTYNVQATSVRFFNVYGPGEADYGKHTTIVRAFKQSLLKGEDFKVNGDGSIIRDYTHVSDVVGGLLQVRDEMLTGKHKKLYELGGAKLTSVKEIAEVFHEGTSLAIKYGPHRHGDPQMTIADMKKQPSRYEPTISVLDHIREWKALGCPND